LETESDLAKISLSLAPLRQVVAAAASPSGLGVTVRRAMADAVDVSNALVTFAIRAIGVMLPVAVMFGLPLAGLVWWLKRRQRRLVATLAANG
jgi:VIT1/CCC1 family predicted Fe2+/Mn2+ transporter